MSDLDDLYQQFIEVHQQHHGLEKRDEYDSLEKANEYEGLTDGHFQVLMNPRSKRPLSEEDKLNGVMVKEERNTWRLLKAFTKDRLLTGDSSSESVNGSRNFDQTEISRDSNRMDDSDETFSHQNGTDHHISMNGEYVNFSEDQLIGNYYVNNPEIRRMQVIVDWLEANDASDLAYKDEEDKVEFYAEGPMAWENTFHALKANYNTEILDLDITVNPDCGLELCSSMDPDAPFRTKKSLAHQDKEVEIRLFKHLLRFIRAGKLDEGQELAQRVGYYWLSASLEGWLPYSDPNLDQENLGTTAIHHPNEIRPITGNRKRDVWKRTCFIAARTQGLNSCEKAVLGVLGGNLKSVLPVCHSWADQLWARIKCSIDVKIERALRDPNVIAQDNRNLIDLPREFYENYQNLENIFKSMRDQKIVSPYKEATIHQTIQRYIILNNVDGLLSQLSDWCATLDFDTCDRSLSPHFLRCFAHVVLFLRELDLVSHEDARATKILESYISLLTKLKMVEGVAYYSSFLPKDNQTLSFARLLATITDREERRHCLRVAKESKLDVDEITQTVVELIRNETPEAAASNTSNFMFPSTNSDEVTPKTSQFDKRKIDALDYLLLLDVKNYIAILHNGNILLRHFALQRKMDAVKETFLKLPANLNKSVEELWKVHTNSDIPNMLRNNIRELDSFRALLEVQEELAQWSEWHHKKPEEPRKPANMSKFCDNVNYEQRMKQYHQDLGVWREIREARTNSLIDKISQMFYFPGGWMRDLQSNDSEADDVADQTINTNISNVNGTSNPDQRSQIRLQQLSDLRLNFVPYMISICFNILHLTNRYEDCLKLSHLLADEDLGLYKEFSKAQVRDFLDKMSEVTKLIVKQSLAAEETANSTSG